MEALSAGDTSEWRTGSARSDDRLAEQAEAALRTCSKTRCAQIATSTFRFDYKISKVWLSLMPADPEDAGYVLCELHAELFTVPIGWTVEDTREPEVDVRADRERGHGRRLEAIDADHPAVRARSKRLEIRPAKPTGADTPAPLDEHPSGPLDLESRTEPPEVTREINRLARHLALDADTDPGAGVPSDLFASSLDYSIDAADQAPDVPPAQAPGQPGTSREPSRSQRAEPAPAGEYDDDSTFGDDIVGEDRTEQISLDDLEQAARGYLDDDRRRHDPPARD